LAFQVRWARGRFDSNFALVVITEMRRICTDRRIQGRNAASKEQPVNLLRGFYPQRRSCNCPHCSTIFATFCFMPIHLWERMKNRDALTSPPSVVYVGDDAFRKTRNELTECFMGIGGPKPRDSVLDIRCGLVRMSVPLANDLPDGDSGHIGSDIVNRNDSATRTMRWRYQDLKFVLADSYNNGYCPKGRLQARECVSPAGTI